MPSTLANLRHYRQFYESLFSIDGISHFHVHKNHGAIMQVIIFLSLFLLIQYSAFTQSSPRRLVLIEEFTSATCKPCVDADKVLKVVAKLDSGIIALKYHLNIPSPGDPFYKANTVHNDARGALYAIPALPASRVNGHKSVDPRDSLAMWNLARLDQQMPYPISMSIKQEVVSGNEMKVTVDIDAEIELKDYVLHTAVYTDLVNLPNIVTTLPASNGQTEFASSMMTLLPDEKGTIWNSNPKEKKSITLNYTKGSGELWNSTVNVIAFLQNPRTLEIIQAATSVQKPIGTMISTTLSFPPTISPVFEALPPQGVIMLKTSIGNATNAPITYNSVSLAKSSRTPQDWTLKLTGEQSTFTLNPGEKKEISMEFQRSAQPGIGEVILTFAEASGKTYAATPITIVSKESEAFLVQDNLSGTVGPFSDAIAFPGVKRYIAMTTNEFMQNIDKFTSLKRFIWHCADSGRIVKAESDFMLGLANKGVSFLLSGQFITNNMFFDKVPIFDTLGVTYAGYMVRNTAYSLNGVQGDTISNGLTLPCAPRSYAFYPMKLKNKANTSITPILALSTSSTGDTIGGVRVQRGTNRMVYLGLHPFAITDSSARKTLIDRSLAWIENFTFIPNPKLTSSATSIDFGTVASMTGNTKKCTLTNPGNVETLISSMTIKGADQTAYSINPATLSTIPAGGNVELTITFSPSGPGTKNAELHIVPENTNIATLVVALSGAYVPSSIEEQKEIPLITVIDGGIIIHSKTEKGDHYRIIDLTGKLHDTGEIESHSIRLPLLNSGLYFFQLIAQDGIKHIVPFIY